MALWTPADITTALWLDAADSSTLFDAVSGGSAVAADGAVARWEDKSGNARHATQATLANRPIRLSSMLNSRDVCNFPLTPFITAANYSQPPGSQFVVFCRTGSFTTNGTIGNSRASGLVGFRAGGSPSSNINTLGQQGYITGFIDGTSNNLAPSFAYEIPLDQPLQVNMSSTSITSASFTLQIGRDSSSAARGMNGYIAEWVVLSSGASTDDRQLIEGYLAHKWGLAGSLPIDHPYKSSAPTTGTIQTRRRRQLVGYGL